MRIGTWNLQRGGRSGWAVAHQMEALQALDFDIMVLTEPPPEFEVAGRSVISSPAERDGREAWVAIVGDSLEPIDPPLEFAKLAVGARSPKSDPPVTVLGSVLPWLAAPRQASKLALDGEDSFAMFRRFVAAQAAVVHQYQRTLREDLIVWAGDFNQTLTGPIQGGGSEERRNELSTTIARLGLAAWNCDAPHAKSPLHAIDLICGSKGSHPDALSVISSRAAGKQLTDHAGYIVAV